MFKPSNIGELPGKDGDLTDGNGNASNKHDD